MNTCPKPRDALDGRRLDTASSVIAALAGPDARLRADQIRAVAALCEPAARVLVVQATGWGKSAVYWAATAIRRSEGAGLTLVVSPLLSLMRDQVVAAERAGLQAATINSSNSDAWAQIEDDAVAGRIDVLLVSPERLANPGFGRRVLDALAGHIGLLVIDEAHAISDWGHDFRPDYRRVSDVLQGLNPMTPVLATTATANARVTEDVAAQLGESTLVLRGELARSSLQLSVVDSLPPLERYAWVVDHLPQLPGSGIIYTLTVADARRLATAITAAHGAAFPVAAYMGELDTDKRERLEDALRTNELKALVATSALGMGYDKPDLGFVVHVGSPPSPVSYYQQVGRAGRGIDHALVTLLPSESDAGVWDYFATATIPDPDQMARLLAALKGYDHDDPATTTALEAETGLRRTRVDLMLKQLAVDEVVERVGRGWVATGREWTYDAAHYDGIIAARRREADIMRAYTRSEDCLMQLLQQALDDPTARACGRCSVCLGGLPAPLTKAPHEQAVRAISAALRGENHMLEPRKMWPGGSFGKRGRIPAEQLAEPGRTIVYADAPEWRDVIRETFVPAGRAPDDLKAACISTLGRWRNSWCARPDIVVGMAAVGLLTLTTDVADHIAELGRLPRADVSWTGSLPDTRPMSSADEASSWEAVLSLDDDFVADVRDRTVLLVVDATASRWPITIAAAKLRHAGARAVLPLLLHQRI